MIRIFLIVFIILAQVENHVYGQVARIDFDKALKIADSLNPEIKNGLSRIREAEARKQQVASNLLPQLSASANYSRLGEVPQGKKYLLGNSNNDYYADITVKQLLFAGGKYRNQGYAADTVIKTEEQKLTQVRRNIRLAVARAYYDAVKLRFAGKVQRELIERTRVQLNIAELLFNGGKITNLDVVRLRTQLLIAEGQLSTLESQANIKQYLLAQAIGITDIITVTDSVLPAAPEIAALDIAYLQQELAQTPELQAIQLVYQKAILDEKIAKADYLPAVSMNAGYNFEGGQTFPDNPNWVVGASVTIPIYRGNGIRAQVAQAHERTLQAQNSIEQTSVGLTARLNSAIESVNDKRLKIGIAKQILESADETARIAELRYATGKLSTVELIDAQNVSARAQQDLFNAKADYAVALEEFAVICPSVLKEKESK